MGALVSHIGEGTLATLARKWRDALNAGENGPLQICAEVVATSHAWDRYRYDAGDVEFTSWLCTHVHNGRGLAWFESRLAAVQKLGPWSKNLLAHNVAVWVAKKVGSPTHVEKLRFALTQRTKDNAGACLTLSMAKPLVYDIIGAPKKKKIAECVRCEELTKLLKENGIDIPG